MRRAPSSAPSARALFGEVLRYPAGPVKRKKAMSRSDDVTLASLARAAVAACGGNPEAAAEYILVQVISNRKLLRSIFLPTSKTPSDIR